MSDEPDQTSDGASDGAPDGGLDEASDAHIRSLLADLGSGPDGEAMPPEVAARLDDTLARLVAERGESEERSEAEERGEAEEPVREDSGNVVPLRRRWASRATAAAAAVIVLGAGGVAAANLGVFSGTSADSKSSTSAGGGSAADSAPEPAPESAAPSDSGSKALSGTSAQAIPRVRSVSFAADAARVLKEPYAPAAGSSERSKSSDDTSGGGTDSGEGAAQDSGSDLRSPQMLRSLGCPGPEITDGSEASPVVYDGRVAVLVAHPVSDGEQLVEAWNCRGTRRLDQATITP